MLERMVTLIHIISSDTVVKISVELEMLPLQLPEIKTEIKHLSPNMIDHLKKNRNIKNKND